jgi:cob(I)alamin adenosyltransferase
MRTGLVHIYTGDGKGKTTASAGLAVRANGSGMKVLFAQLFKESTSEVEPMKKIGIVCRNFPAKHPLFQKYTPEEFKLEALRCKAFVKGSFEVASKGNYSLMVIDELGPALSSKMVDPDEIAGFIKNKPVNLELALTGRGFPEKITALADYVSEIKMIKHPFEKGVQARKGIEY